MVYYVSGDIFATEGIKALAHGCNCKGGMDAGIALQFKRHWPKMFNKYKKLCLLNKFTVGNIFLWEENNQYIFNLATQQSWTTCATLEAIAASIHKMLDKASKIHLSTIVIPKIGAGFGRLKWINVKTMIEEVAINFSVDLIICEKFIKGVPLFAHYES